MELNEFSRSSLAQAINQQGRQLTSLRRTLEKRVLLDASVAADISHSTGDTSAPDTAESADTKNGNNQIGNSGDEDNTAESSTPGASQRQELVVIDLQLDDAQALIDDLIQQADEVTEENGFLQLATGERSVSLLTLDADDSLQTVTDYLTHSDQTYDAIHLISHGGAGGIDVGGEELSLTSLVANEAGSHSAQLQSWETSLSANADILLYGCNTGYSLTGEQFIEQVASLTGADVAASDDATGSALRGGDWELEQQKGEVETDIAFSKLLQGTWEGLLAAEPGATIDAPAEDFINESTDITIEFDNLGTDTGYGPFLDVVLGPGADLQNIGGSQGASFVEYTFTGGQWVDSNGNPVLYHPYDFNQTGAIPLPPGQGEGSTWYAIQLPFGSFTGDQPPYEIIASILLDEATGAMVGTPIPIWVRPGFAYGNDPLNNPDVDPPIVAPPIVDQITPTVMLVDKVALDGDGDNASIGDDGETVTGPSEPVTWQVTVDIANASQIDNLVITEEIPENFYYLPGTVTVTYANGATPNFTITEPPEGANLNSELIVTFTDPVEGTTVDNDIVITYSGYVPDVDANGNPIVINDGANDVVLNTASVTGDYNGQTVTDDDDAQIIATATALQKDVALIQDNGDTGFTPGDRVQYTLTMQVSDYMSLDNLVANDLVGDGLEVDPSSISMEVFFNGDTFADTTVGAGNSTVTVNGNGSTSVNVNISQELADRGITSGNLEGDLVPDAVTDGTTTVTITYEATILERYVETGNAVDALDTINNQASVSGTATSANGQTVENNSSEEIVIQGADSSKSVYAVNGSTNPDDLDEISVGDSVTFAIEVDLGTLDYQGITLTDYLPQPVFLAQAPTFVDTAQGTNTPGVNQWGFGPNTEFASWPPGYLDGANVTTSADLGNNSITWNYEAVNQDNSAGGIVQLLFTVEVQDQPFTDGLQLTNIASVAIENTDGTTILDPDGVQVEVLSPELILTKGVVSTDNGNGIFDPTTIGPVTFEGPGGAGTPPWAGGPITSGNLDTAPIDSNLSDVDAGDTVKFAITLENTGGSDAFDLVISDSLPPGFEIPAGAPGLNLQVFTGAGDPVNFSGDLFSGGITLEDPSAMEGALNEGRDPDTGATTDGSNIIIITYDLIASDDVRPNQIIENTAQLEEYGGVDEGNDYTAGNSNINWQDDADVEIAGNTVEKDLVGTNINSTTNANNEAVIGEVITYTVTLTIAEGETPSASIRDTLDQGLEFIGITSVTTSSGDIASTVPLTPAGLAPTVNGQQVIFDLGDITNTNRDNSVAETITITYEVLVDNVAANQSGAQRNNNARFFWDSTDDTVDNPTVQDNNSAPNVTVIEPDLQVDKTLTNTPVPIDGGDAVQYTIVVSHSAFSDTDAFDATFTDTLPPELTGVALSSATLTVNGLDTDVLNLFQTNGNTIETIPGQSFDLLFGDTLTLVVDATVVNNVLVGTQVSNTATVDWQSIDGDDPNERTGEDGAGGSPDDYETDDTFNFTITSPEAAKIIVQSSIEDAFNDRAQVVIGETVIFLAGILIPEGVVEDGNFTDTLPAGMEFVSLNNIIIGNDLTLTGSTFGPPTETVNPDGSTTLDFGSVDQILNVGGQDPLEIDDLIAFVYTVRITNVDTNQAGTDLTNNAEFTSSVNNVSSSATVTVIEPQLTIDKSANILQGDNGDLVNYTITVENPDDGSSTTAYDISFSDPLPAELTGATVSATLTSGAGISDISGNFVIVGGEVVLDPQAALDLEPGELVTITVSGTLANTVAGSTITNTSDIDWTSLDGADPNERTGDDGEGGPLNDYATSDQVEITVNGPAFEKTLVSTSQNDGLNDDTEATIGEIVTFSVTVTVPEATLSGQITDVYGPGFEFIDLVGVSASNPGATPITPGDVTVTNDAGNNTVEFDFGTLQNTDTDNTTVETITLTYRVRVTDIPANVQGVTLTNDATLSYDTDGDTIPDADLTDDASVDIVEPELIVDKQLLSGSPLTLGGLATYQLTIRLDPSSGANAYNVTIEDAQPPFIASVENVQISVTGGSPTIVNNSTANLLSLDVSEIDSTTVITITIDARVTSDTAAIGQSTTNTVEVESTSLDTPPGGNDTAIEREYDYTDSVTAPIGAVDLFVDKDDAGITAAPGDDITYTINYGNTGNIDATGVVITESLPEYVTFNPADNPGWTLNGDILTFNIGDLAAGASGSVELVVTVIDPLPAGVDETNNTVSIDGDESNGTDPTPDNNTDEDVTPLEAAPDYVIDKVEEFDDPAFPGETISWSITITNEGNQDGTGVIITDQLPSTPFVSGYTASDGGVVDTDAGTVVWDIGDLAVGETVTVTLTGVVADQVPPRIPQQINAVEVTDDGTNGPDPTPENNVDSETFDITEVDLSITKDDGGISTTPGGTVVYTLTYSNLGTALADNVAITETLPPNTTFDATSSTAGWVDNGDGTLTFDLGTLDPGETGTVEFAVIVDAPLPAGVEEILNNTEISYDDGRGPDQNLDNNTAEDNTPIDAQPDYVIDKIENFTDPANPGDTIEWTIEVSNQGNQDGTGVVVTDTLPDLGLFNNFTADNGGVIDLSNATVTWDIGDLAVGESVTLTLSAVVNDLVPSAIPTQLNSVEVSDDGANGPDPTPENNNDSESFRIVYVDVAIDKSASTDTALPGDTVIYTLEYTNFGTALATGNVITETLPENTQFDAANSTPGWVVSGDQFTFDIGDLAPGDDGQIQFAVIIDNPLPAGVDTFNNSARIDDDGNNGPDQNPDNNTSTDRSNTDVLVRAAPDYAIDKIENFADPTRPGNTISWTIVATNEGNQDGTGVVITDQLPDQSLFSDFIASDGGIVDTVAGTVTWNIGDLAVGESVTLTLTTTVNDQIPANVSGQVNTVTIDDDGDNGPDPTPENNTDSETFEILFVDLFIDKDDNGVVPRPTESIIYTLDYGNRGNATSTGVVITETLPPNTTFDAANSTPGWVQNGDTYSFDVGNLAPGERGNVTFAVTVNYPISVTIQQTENTAIITDDGDNGPDQNPDDNIDTDKTPFENDTNVDNITLSQLRPDYIYPPREWVRQAPELHGRLISVETESTSANLQGGRNGGNFDPAFGSVDGSFYPNDWSRVFRNDLTIDSGMSQSSLGQPAKSSPLEMHRDFAPYRANSLFGEFERPAASPEPEGTPQSAPAAEPLPAPLQSLPEEPVDLGAGRNPVQQQLDEIVRELSEARVSPLLAALAAMTVEEAQHRPGE
ncbi:isopeptide-forming domain-containing fimbrial protein [uncultured Microbulbifer sp.]|uniref:isopeptide-forming domain-containing fimbrial protein n=1 Tax=uncultured Microbulbifer sp. TaxID=348147 RepID=UPI00262E9AAB|nr:isopeptide-forming domain-containing fimbrial protein [uncultured Microbulbifer sp.]